MSHLSLIFCCCVNSVLTDRNLTLKRAKIKSNWILLLWNKMYIYKHLDLFHDLNTSIQIFKAKLIIDKKKDFNDKLILFSKHSDRPRYLVSRSMVIIDLSWFFSMYVAVNLIRLRHSTNSRIRVKYRLAQYTNTFK